ncbi:MAG: undecaprenyl-diphosphate phosphatase [Gammaproteobacteria bacterium]|nr:undecaprenyl-diphosphate phosphatase [Gammaproteobacteria bacterium]
MELMLHIAVLALVQGFTEFLPISSSAHLILVPVLTGWQDQGLAYDIAAHLGTLVAVCAYFRRDLLAIAGDCWRRAGGGPETAASRTGWLLLWATVPAAVAGLVLHDVIERELRSPLVIAATTAGFGLLLWWADRIGRRGRGEGELRLADALLIGCAQALALVPGTSRSGITITAGLLRGFTRQAAARFSFLMSIPVTALAVMLELWDLLQGQVHAAWTGLALISVLSCASAWLCIYLFLRVLDRIGMAPFAVYRLALGAVLFAMFL